MSTDVLRVGLALSPGGDVPVGRLALDGPAVIFEFDPAFAATGLSLNPALGRPAAGLVRPRDARAFYGLHGVFADSLPDAWGEVLLDRQLRRKGGALARLTSLERLALVGRNGRGALVYATAADRTGPGKDVDLDLDHLAHQAGELLEGDESSVLGELEVLGGSSGGARPKVQVDLDDTGRARSGSALPAPGFSAWIVKFRARADRFPDVGPLEAAYADTARRAGIDMPRTRLIPARMGPGYFATERFDRLDGGRRVHMLSIAGMLDADWTVPSIDYESLLEAVRGATRDERDVRQMFRRMVFNVLAVNRDDHTKQHSLLLMPDGRWRLSPAYDLTFSQGPGNEHYLTVNGRGRNIGRSDLLAVAASQSIDRRAADAIVDEVAQALGALPALARDYGVTRATLSEVEGAVSGA